MDPAGMVHALYTIHHLLRPDGSLIDIRPGTDRPEIFVRARVGSHFASYLEEKDGYLPYTQAQSAVEQAVADGIFVIEHAGKFNFATHADTLAALKNYFTENWMGAILTPPVEREIKALYKRIAGKKEIVVSEQISIARLRVKKK